MNIKKQIILISTKIYLFILILLQFTFTQNNAQPMKNLKFNEDGKFKILQFTDIHLDIQNQSETDSVINMMTDIIKKENPNLVVLTGDIVTSKPVEKAWEIVTEPMRKLEIPWAVVFGNHDYEQGSSNKEIMDYLVTLPYNFSEAGPENISGVGNYVLQVKSSDSDNLKTILYFIDSNAYTYEKDNEELGNYDWIKFDQIQWYRNISKNFTTNNDMKPLPALAFFHIPLPEYDLIKKFPTTIGDRDEEVCSPKINSGMYNAFLECGDVMGMFVGHDHNNNYIGTLNNIALAYGCKTGKNSYGDFDKGGRVIVLYEDERKFDTWIHNTNEPSINFATYPDSFAK
ncbi:MAG: metallophosphoesterase family protein [Ignavibacteriae bacterium]|nr:metallophosphoesterase family protein [Ignavibacteriota bacterium]